MSPPRWLWGLLAGLGLAAGALLALCAWTRPRPRQRARAVPPPRRDAAVVEAARAAELDAAAAAELSPMDEARDRTGDERTTAIASLLDAL